MLCLTNVVNISRFLESLVYSSENRLCGIKYCKQCGGCVELHIVCSKYYEIKCLDNCILYSIITLLLTGRENSSTDDI